MELLMRPEHTETIKKLGAALKRCFDMPRLLLRVKRVACRPLDWVRIMQTAEVSSQQIFVRAMSLRACSEYDTCLH